MDDLREGKGTYKSADGDSYNGLWRADKMNGHGTYTWADGGQYTGQWVNDGREGLGVYRSSPSDLTGPYEEKYDGWWKADKMHGQGARRLPLSRSLFAPVPLTINIVLPAGKYYWSNGDVYDGMWREDKRHGGATLPYSSSALGPHLFSWSHALCASGGVLVCATGDRYEGGWKHDARDGRGTFVRADGRKLVGRWRNSQFVGDGNGR